MPLDYGDVLRALVASGARFAVAGGFACVAHMWALSWVHPEQPFLVVDLLVGEPVAWSAERVETMRLFGVETPVLRRAELIRQKRAAGREKDLVDVRELEKLG